MNIKQAVKWADVWREVPSEKPSGDEQALIVLVNEVRRLREWIARDGTVTNTCTFNVLGEICEGCECCKAIKKNTLTPVTAPDYQESKTFLLAETWTCSKCGQANTSWAATCGRCQDG